MNRILWFMRHPATSGIFVCTAILASGNLPASAQTAVSPYTIYGIGALDNGNHGSGAGISFASDKFTAGVDYSFYKYSSLDTGSDIIKYKDRNRLTAGITYVPSRYDVRRYWKRIKFQMGAYVDDSYLTASGSRGLKFNRYTFPVSNRNTISESSLGLTFGVTFGESWFVRKRLE